MQGTPLEEQGFRLAFASAAFGLGVHATLLRVFRLRESQTPSASAQVRSASPLVTSGGTPVPNHEYLQTQPGTPQWCFPKPLPVHQRRSVALVGVAKKPQA